MNRPTLLLAALSCLLLAACASPPSDFFGGGGTNGPAAAGKGGDADGQSTAVKTNPAFATNASDATALGFEWARTATVPVAGDVYQLVLGDASFLSEDAVEKAYRARIDSALAAAAAENAPPEAFAAADAAIERLRTYHETRREGLISTGKGAPGTVIFIGSKVAHGTTSADVPSSEVVQALADLAKGVGDVTDAAKGTARTPKPPAEATK